MAKGPARVRLPTVLPPKRVEDNTHAVPTRLRGKTDPNVPPDQPYPLTGTGMNVFAQADGAFEKLVDQSGVRVADVEIEAMAVLAEGAVGGSPVVGFLIPLPDGRKVLARTTLKLLLTGAGMIVAVHGDPRLR